MLRITTLKLFCFAGSCTALLGGCKEREETAQAKLVGGEQAQPGEFPGVIAIGQQGDAG